MAEAATAMAEAEAHQRLVSHITTLVESFPPPFIYIHDPSSPRLSSTSLRTALNDLKHAHPDTLRLSHAYVNAVSCFTSRLFFDTVLNALVGWTPTWEDGCQNWLGMEDGEDGDGTGMGMMAKKGQRFNDNVDGFLHGLIALRERLGVQAMDEAKEKANIKTKTNGKANGKAKGKEKEVFVPEPPDIRLVLVVERAERLKDNLPDLIVPLTRLAELSRIEITTIFHSELYWDQIRPPLGAAMDPFIVDVPMLSKRDILTRLTSSYLNQRPDIPIPSMSTTTTATPFDPDTYHPNLRSLYAHFVSTVYSICSPFTTDPDELAYIIAARWPGFVQPILDEHRRRQSESLALSTSGEYEGEENEEEEERDEANVVGELQVEEVLELAPPSEEARLRLIKLFTPTMRVALEQLYPRLCSAYAWAEKNRPPPDLLSYHPRDAPSILSGHTKRLIGGGGGIGGTDTNITTTIANDSSLFSLPRMAKFILVASFIASTNPAKSDMRMFGRGPDERAKRRRKRTTGAGGGSPKKATTKKGTGTTKSTSAVKIPQRLLGPIAFPLDRMLAMLGVLLEENDVEVRPPMPEYTVPGEYTEMEISRLAVYAQVAQLTSMHLLHRTSSTDRGLDPSPSYKCGISYEAALKLAKEIDVSLTDLLWDPV